MGFIKINLQARFLYKFENYQKYDFQIFSYKDGKSFESNEKLFDRINELYRIISSFSNEKIKSFSTFLIIVGSVIIYFTFRIYDFS